MSRAPFDTLADRYDAWYDSEDGRAVLSVELACLQRVLPARGGRWLEIGVGTGRFAHGLGAAHGLDPSLPALALAARRGIRCVAGRAEQLPYLSASFKAVLVVATLSFLDDPAAALRESARALRRNGSLIIGMIPADSSWGKYYEQKGREGHPFYSLATFYSCEDLRQTAAAAGFAFEQAASCLFTPPGTPLGKHRAPAPGVSEDAGFVALRFALARSQSSPETKASEDSR